MREKRVREIVRDEMRETRVSRERGFWYDALRKTDIPLDKLDEISVYMMSQPAYPIQNAMVEFYNLAQRLKKEEA